jgi:protein TonB
MGRMARTLMERLRTRLALLGRRLARLWPESLEGKVAVSAAVHVVVLFLAFNSWWLFAHRLKTAGTAHGSQVVVMYNPVGQAKPAQTVARSSAAPKHVQHKLVLRQVSTEIVAPSASTHTDALGQSSVSITYIQPFPNQRPDLSHAGATGDVVVDIQIDDRGRIAQLHKRRGMGDAIDEMVIATVEQWLFRPAVQDGKPITSDQELHFHYERNRNVGGCGWECFTLEAQ